MLVDFIAGPEVNDNSGYSLIVNFKYSIFLIVEKLKFLEPAGWRAFQGIRLERILA